MEFVYIGMKYLAFMVVPVCVFFFFKIMRNPSIKKKGCSRSVDINNTAFQRVGRSLHELEEGLNVLSNEVKDLYSLIMKGEENFQTLKSVLIKGEQDRVSWIASSKHLPDPYRMVLILDKDKNECHGFIDEKKEGWTISSLGSQMVRVSLDKITHWKKIFTL